MMHNVPVQSLIDHIKTAIDVDPWAKEMVENLLKEQEAEIKRLKGELHEFGDLFHTLSEKTKVAMAEQPQIVLCKDCKNGTPMLCTDDSKTIYCSNERISESFLEPDWFCADGERGEQK